MRLACWRPLLESPEEDPGRLDELLSLLETECGVETDVELALLDTGALPVKAAAAAAAIVALRSAVLDLAVLETRPTTGSELLAAASGRSRVFSGGGGSESAAALRALGWPSGLLPLAAVVELAGPSAAGKTQFALNCVSAWQAADLTARALWIDSGSGFSARRFEDHGGDLDRTAVQQAETAAVLLGQLAAVQTQLSECFAELEGLAIVVVDAVTPLLFPQQSHMPAARTRVLALQRAVRRAAAQLAGRFGICVVLVNHAVSDGFLRADPGAPTDTAGALQALKPALGQFWAATGAPKVVLWMDLPIGRSQYWPLAGLSAPGGSRARPVRVLFSSCSVSFICGFRFWC